MNKTLVLFLVSFFTLLISAAILIRGDSLLTFSLSAKFYVPIGSFITWAGLIALPLSIYYGLLIINSKAFESFKLLDIYFKIVFISSVLWLPVSYLLAGNMAFTFSQLNGFQGGSLAFQCFLFYTGLVVLCSVIFLLMGLGIIVINKIRHRKN
nr:hypothetical protein [uncultured Carboxylicivirga sp.]